MGAGSGRRYARPNAARAAPLPSKGPVLGDSPYWEYEPDVNTTFDLAALRRRRDEPPEQVEPAAPEDPPAEAELDDAAELGPDTAPEPSALDRRDVELFNAPEINDLSEVSRAPAAFDADTIAPPPPVAPPRRRWWWFGRRSGPSAAELAARATIDRVRMPFAGSRVVAIVSTKGGVGKTTTTINLGHTFASLRPDRVVALDANPDAGSLGYRVERETPYNAADLLRAIEDVRTYTQLRPFTSQTHTRLEVIAAPDDPRETRKLGRADFDRLIRTLRDHYNLVLADCGTGILDPATRGVVQAADQLVVVTSPRVDSARAVTYLLGWLSEHGLEEQVRQAVLVINAILPDGYVDIEALTDHFRPYVRAIARMPWDAELARGGTTDMNALDAATRHAYVELAAAVASGLPLASTPARIEPR